MRSGTILAVLVCGVSACSDEICEVPCDSNFIIDVGDGSGTALAGFSGSMTIGDDAVDLTCPSTASSSIIDQFGRTIRFECNRAQILGTILPALSRPSDLQLTLDVRATGGSAEYEGDVVVRFDQAEEVCDRECFNGVADVTLQAPSPP